MDRRGRELVSRFYVHELNLDWRRGASYFGSMLIGYESCSNWASWASAASLDNGMMREGADEWKLAEAAEALDPTSSFVKHWLPELRGVPEDRVQVRSPNSPFLYNPLVLPPPFPLPPLPPASPSLSLPAPLYPPYFPYTPHTSTTHPNPPSSPPSPAPPPPILCPPPPLNPLSPP